MVLEYEAGLRLGKVIICLVYFLRLPVNAGNLAELRAREVAYDIVQKNLNSWSARLAPMVTGTMEQSPTLA